MKSSCINKTLSIFSYFGILSFILCLASPVLAQQMEISGKVITQDESPLEFASVALYQQSDSLFVSGTVTDSNGEFRFSGIPETDYYLRISSIGFKTLYYDVMSSDVDSKIELVLIEDLLMLDDVQIEAERPVIQVMADKIVFNVAGSLSASGSNAFELLRQAPGVFVDNNENLIVEGKTGVQVYLDGRPTPLSGQDLANYLKTLQSSDIESIEIITQPSSRFDAEGNAGILNIRLRRNENFGTSGTANTGYGLGRYSRYNSGVSVFNRSSRTNLSLNYSNSFNKSYSFINLYRLQANTIFDAQSSNIGNSESHNVRLGLDFIENPRNTFGIILSGNFSDNTSENSSRTPIIVESSMQTLQVLRAESNTESDQNNFTGNLNYRFQNDEGRSFSTDLDFGMFDSDRFNFQPNTYLDGTETVINNTLIYQMITPVDIRIASVKADYTELIWGGNLGMGLKSSRVDTDNTFEFYDVIDNETTINTNRSNRFKYRENVNAAYLNFNRSVSSFNAQFGLRIEETRSLGKLTSEQETGLENVRRRYLDLFPSAGITYTMSLGNSMALAYSRRIQRPNYRTLNPFERQIDELSFSRGNPFLEPQYTNTLRLTHTHNFMLNTSLSVSRTTGFAAQVTEAVGENQSVIQTQNIANQDVINLGVSYPYQIAGWWNVFLSVNANHSRFEATDERFVAISQNSFNAYGQNTITLPAGIQLEVSGWFSSPSVWGGTYQTRSMGSLDAAVQKKFMQDRLNLRVGMTDILYTSPWRGDTRFADVFIRGNGGWDSRQLRINLSFNFGNTSSNRPRQRNTGIEEESKRVD